ncbi:hypothetical protein PoB_001825000 [Plakobranchus ocellatus]|uniref:Uncharacterized protein n=1 Tax=Plakobranchus ocellatus TaxID=259542 RepID=A0AAV3Z8A4_9GAST|nr:hypothetical protein PoB_001825000 [Plakobranchus ocellatus]
MHKRQHAEKPIKPTEMYICQGDLARLYQQEDCHDENLDYNDHDHHHDRDEVHDYDEKEKEEEEEREEVKGGGDKEKKEEEDNDDDDVDDGDQLGPGYSKDSLSLEL